MTKIVNWVKTLPACGFHARRPLSPSEDDRPIQAKAASCRSEATRALALLLRGSGERQFRVTFSHGLSFQVDAVGAVHDAIEDRDGTSVVRQGLAALSDNPLGLGSATKDITRPAHQSLLLNQQTRLVNRHHPRSRERRFAVKLERVGDATKCLTITSRTGPNRFAGLGLLIELARSAGPANLS